MTTTSDARAILIATFAGLFDDYREVVSPADGGGWQRSLINSSAVYLTVEAVSRLPLDVKTGRRRSEVEVQIIVGADLEELKEYRFGASAAALNFPPPRYCNLEAGWGLTVYDDGTYVAATLPSLGVQPKRAPLLDLARTARSWLEERSTAERVIEHMERDPARGYVTLRCLAQYYYNRKNDLWRERVVQARAAWNEYMSGPAFDVQEPPSFANATHEDWLAKLTGSRT